MTAFGTPFATNTYAQAWNEKMKSMPKQQGMTFTPAYSTGGQGLGNLAYAAPDARPAGFSTRVRGFDGRSYEPGAYINQRDAFIQTLNDSRRRMSSQNTQQMQPNRDYRAMWSQAGDMVRGGWQNPLAGLFR